MSDLGLDIDPIDNGDLEDDVRIPVRKAAVPGWLYLTLGQIWMYIYAKLFPDLTGKAGMIFIVDEYEQSFDFIDQFTRNYVLPLAFTTTPTSDEILMLHTFVEDVEFPANWAGVQKYVGTNPAATFALPVAKSTGGGAFASAGTLSISTAGALTATTAGGTAISFAAGDTIRVMAPTGLDATIKNVAITLKGTR